MVWQTYLCLEGTLVSFPQLSPSGFSRLAQVRKLLDLGLVEPIDDGVLPLLNMYALDLVYVISIGTMNESTCTYLPLILEPNLTHRHTPILLQITPRRIHNRDVVFLVALNTVRLGQLRTVGQQLFSHPLPVFVFW
jgi:hypothetical protein